MSKNTILKLTFIFLILPVLSFVLFFPKETKAAQEAYISRVEYSINDDQFGSYNSDTGKGLVAIIEDINGVVSGGKVYKIQNNVPYDEYTGSSSYITYQDNKIVKIETQKDSDILFYAKVTVINSGTDDIQGACLAGYETWGNTGWQIGRSDISGGVSRILPGESKTVITRVNLKDFPEGYYRSRLLYCIWAQIHFDSGYPFIVRTINPSITNLPTCSWLALERMDGPLEVCPSQSIGQGWPKMAQGQTYQRKIKCTLPEGASPVKLKIFTSWAEDLTYPSPLPRYSIYQVEDNFIVNPGVPSEFILGPRTFEQNLVGNCYASSAIYVYENLESSALTALVNGCWPGHGYFESLNLFPIQVYPRIIVDENQEPVVRVFYSLASRHMCSNSLINPGDYQLRIKIKDNAGNRWIYEKTIDIEETFNPPDTTKQLYYDIPIEDVPGIAGSAAVQLITIRKSDHTEIGINSVSFLPSPPLYFKGKDDLDWTSQKGLEIAPFFKGRKSVTTLENHIYNMSFQKISNVKIEDARIEAADEESSPYISNITYKIDPEVINEILGESKKNFELTVDYTGERPPQNIKVYLKAKITYSVFTEGGVESRLDYEANIPITISRKKYQFEVY